MTERKRLTRRNFLKIAGLTGVGAGVAACAPPLAKAAWEFFTQTPPTPTATPLPPPTPGQITIATATPPPLLPLPTEFTNISYDRIGSGITGKIQGYDTDINTLRAIDPLTSNPGRIVGYKVDNDFIASLVGATKDKESKGNPHLTYSGGVYKGEGQYKNHIVEYSQGFWRAYHPTTKKEVAVINPNSFAYPFAPTPDAVSNKPKVGFPIIEGNNILIVDGGGSEIERHPLFEESAAVARKYGYTGLPAVVSRIGIAPDGLLRVYATEKKVEPATKQEKNVDVQLKTLEAFNPLVGTPLAAVPELSEWINSLVTNVFDSKPVPIESYTGKYGNATTTLDTLKKELVYYPDQYVQKRVVGGQDVDALVINGVPLAFKNSATGEWKRSLEMEKATLDTLKPFVTAMKSAGVATSTADILKRGLQVKNMTGRDGKILSVACVSINTDPKKPENSHTGDYPLFVESEEGWRKIRLNDCIEAGDSLVYKKNDNSVVSDFSYLDLLAREYSTITIAQGNYWKWFERSKDDSIDRYARSDIEAQINTIKSMRVKNPYLQIRVAPFGSFPENNPDWLKGLSSAEAQKQLREHMQQVFDIYKEKGVVPNQYVVTNEPFFQGPGWVREDALYRAAGSYDYIVQAFKDARAIVGPEPILLYNDTANNSLISGQYNFYTELTKKNIDAIVAGGDKNVAVGMQMHLLGNVPVSEDDLAKTMQYYGVPIYLTELDVDVSMIPAGQRAETLSRFYSTVYRAALKSGVCRGISTWNGVDSLSWLVDGVKDKVGADPTMFDKNYQPKLAYYAVLKELLDSQKTS